MGITKKIKLAEMLNKHLRCSCTASHMYTTEAYEWFLILEYERPAYVVKYHKEAKYFCDIIPLSMCGVNPIFASDIAEASLEWSEMLDENQSK